MSVTTEGLNTYAVTLKSKFTATLVTFGNVRAACPCDAQEIALGCMSHPEAWRAVNPIKHNGKAGNPQ